MALGTLVFEVRKNDFGKLLILQMNHGLCKSKGSEVPSHYENPFRRGKGLFPAHCILQGLQGKEKILKDKELFGNTRLAPNGDDQASEW